MGGRCVSGEYLRAVASCRYGGVVHEFEQLATLYEFYFRLFVPR